MKELRVYYETDVKLEPDKKIDPEFDKKMGALAKEQGLHLQRSGYDIEDHVRDLRYVREQ
ncbi:hypothetical protein E3J95_01355 [Candidatus Aerophobetes bacterium]|uniref:Uncharacterized protein n=1 Tax=Aerophobetes bacterium TaxID=2030807 RepID=A0A523QLR3_UNCAE|nr:MAG: hypothetical protein E3J95_01355 [Candidatus Aerophobetes bacterium]